MIIEIEVKRILSSLQQSPSEWNTSLIKCATIAHNLAKRERTDNKLKKIIEHIPSVIKKFGDASVRNEFFNTNHLAKSEINTYQYIFDVHQIMTMRKYELGAQNIQNLLLQGKTLERSH